jgi:hypothetical protein
MRKPKVIPKGFIWDPKHKELIDVRCNNPKLKKLVKTSSPAICISPFFSIPKLKGKAAEQFEKEMKKPVSKKTKKIFKEAEKVGKAIKEKSNTCQKCGLPNEICACAEEEKERARIEIMLAHKDIGRTIRSEKLNKVPFQKYQHIPHLETMRPTPRILLGKLLTWTIKEDGENVTVWNKKKKLHLSSHNMEDASDDIKLRCMNAEDWHKVLEIMAENPTYRLILEECRKGRSVTGVKVYDRAILFLVDIFDLRIMNYLPYTVVYQTAVHHDMPCVKLYAQTRHRTLKDLLKYKNHVFDVCNALHEEGMVVKTYDKDGKYIMAKVKVDIPKPIEKKISKGEVILPQIPDSEIYGAISHVESDFGLTKEPSHDMPLIAQEVAKECKKHYYKNKANLFKYYQNYLETMMVKK